VSTLFAENFAKKLRCAVDYARLARELRHRGHETNQLHNASNAVKVADDELYRGERVQHCRAGVVLGVLWANRCADLAGFGQLARGERQLTAGENQVSGDHRWHVSRNRLSDLG
jgi:hypothetical protein